MPSKLILPSCSWLWWQEPVQQFTTQLNVLTTLDVPAKVLPELEHKPEADLQVGLQRNELQLKGFKQLLLVLKPITSLSQVRLADPDQLFLQVFLPEFMLLLCNLQISLSVISTGKSNPHARRENCQ